MIQKKIRIGMVGGGLDSMIGDIHRYALHLDNQYELVCGVFSNDALKSKKCARFLNLAASRSFDDYKTMFANEMKLPKDERMQVVAIVTPNHMHFVVAKVALENGFHIILEKPITHTIKEAKALEKIVKQTKNLVCVLYTFAGFPMVKEARYLVQSQQLGVIRKIFVEFSQGWLATSAKEEKEKIWRTNPEKSGLSGTIADIGTHAFHLAEYITGLKTISVFANMRAPLSERLLDDDGAVFLKYDNGASGILCASQIASGEEANLKIKIYGEHGSLHWEHDDANSLYLKWQNKPAEILRAGKNNLYLNDHTRNHCRTPAGHPGGFIEAFANHYRNFAFDIRAENTVVDYPRLEEGVRGMQFIEAAITSNRLQKWANI